MPPSYIRVRAVVWTRTDRQTDRHTDARDHNTFCVVYDSRKMNDPARAIGCVCVYIYEGHSRETIDGHAHCMTGLPQVRGYNGEFGYRRNSPWLRRQPSCFEQRRTTSPQSHATSPRRRATLLSYL